MRGKRPHRRTRAFRVPQNQPATLTQSRLPNFLRDLGGAGYQMGAVPFLLAPVSTPHILIRWRNTCGERVGKSPPATAELKRRICTTKIPSTPDRPQSIEHARPCFSIATVYRRWQWARKPPQFPTTPWCRANMIRRGQYNKVRPGAANQWFPIDHMLSGRPAQSQLSRIVANTSCADEQVYPPFSCDAGHGDIRKSDRFNYAKDHVPMPYLYMRRNELPVVSPMGPRGANPN